MELLQEEKSGYRLYFIKRKYSYYFSLPVRDEIERISHGSGSAARSAEPNKYEICLELNKFKFLKMDMFYAALQSYL